MIRNMYASLEQSKFAVISRKKHRFFKSTQLLNARSTIEKINGNSVLINRDDDLNVMIILLFNILLIFMDIKQFECMI